MDDYITVDELKQYKLELKNKSSSDERLRVMADLKFEELDFYIKAVNSGLRIDRGNGKDIYNKILGLSFALPSTDELEQFKSIIGGDNYYNYFSLTKHYSTLLEGIINLKKLNITLKGTYITKNYYNKVNSLLKEVRLTQNRLRQEPMLDITDRINSLDELIDNSFINEYRKLFKRYINKYKSLMDKSRNELIKSHTKIINESIKLIDRLKIFNEKLSEFERIKNNVSSYLDASINLKLELIGNFKEIMPLDSEALEDKTIELDSKNFLFKNADYMDHEAKELFDSMMNNLFIVKSVNPEVLKDLKIKEVNNLLNREMRENIYFLISYVKELKIFEELNDLKLKAFNKLTKKFFR